MDNYSYKVITVTVIFLMVIIFISIYGKTVYEKFWLFEEKMSVYCINYAVCQVYDIFYTIDVN